MTTKGKWREKAMGINKKMAKCMSDEMDRMETDTKSKLDEMKRTIDNKVVDSDTITKLMEEYTKFAQFVNHRYDEHEEWRSTFDSTDKERVKVFNNIIDRMGKCEGIVTKQNEELNVIERKRRKYNLRISNWNIHI